MTVMTQAALALAAVLALVVQTRASVEAAKMMAALVEAEDC